MTNQMIMYLSFIFSVLLHMVSSFSIINQIAQEDKQA